MVVLELHTKFKIPNFDPKFMFNFKLFFNSI